MKAAEISQLLRSGVRVTVNSDDPAYFGGYIVDNYLALIEQAGLSSAEVVTLAENSFAISWIDDGRRAGYLDEVSRYVGDFNG
jgi:adenosine deaminase